MTRTMRQLLLIALILTGAHHFAYADGRAQLPPPLRRLVDSIKHDHLRRMSDFIEIFGSNSDLEVELRLARYEKFILSREQEDKCKTIFRHPESYQSEYLDCVKDVTVETNKVYQQPEKYPSDYLHCLARKASGLATCNWKSETTEQGTSRFIFCPESSKAIIVIYDSIDKKVSHVSPNAGTVGFLNQCTSDSSAPT